MTNNTHFDGPANTRQSEVTLKAWSGRLMVCFIQRLRFVFKLQTVTTWRFFSQNYFVLFKKLFSLFSRRIPFEAEENTETLSQDTCQALSVWTLSAAFASWQLFNKNGKYLQCFKRKIFSNSCEWRVEKIFLSSPLVFVCKLTMKSWARFKKEERNKMKSFKAVLTTASKDSRIFEWFSWKLGFVPFN